MNYDHAFHAGNFADLMKHAILLQLLGRLAGAGPLTVLDTHAGAGRYDLESLAARRSGEAEGGVRRLMGAPQRPEALRPLAAAVEAANPAGGVRLYPGSPTLIVNALRAGDRYIGCELNETACAELGRSVQPLARARGVRASVQPGDGYAAVDAVARSGARALVFIDPPFERADDYGRIVQAATALRAAPAACAAVWTPLKDLETFDALLRGLETAAPRTVTVAQVRLRPLVHPLRINGCAMILIDAPDIAEQAQAVCGWVAGALGEPGGSGRVFRLDG